MATKKVTPKKAAGKKAPARRTLSKPASRKAAAPPVEQPRRLERQRPIESMPPLSDMAYRFALEYMRDCVGTQAAIRAGYSRTSAGQRAFELLQDPRVQAIIAEERAKLAEELEITSEAIARELAALAFANLGDYYEQDQRGNLRLRIDELTPRQRAAISELTVEKTGTTDTRHKIKLHDKQQALVNLAKLLGFFSERHLHGLAPASNGEPAAPWIVQPVAPAPGAGPR